MTDGTVRRFSDLARRVRTAAPRLGPVRLIVVDGPTGSGKTTFARRLATAVRGRGLSVAEIHTDDLLDGWSDMVTFWSRLDDGVLQRVRRGEPGGFRRYDWHQGSFEQGWQQVPVTDVLLVDGVTTARAASRPLCVLSVYLVVVDAELRLRRGIARDGEELRPDLVRWAQREERYFATEQTATYVDLLVDGAPTAAHDPDTEYVQLPRPA
jgi:uridine kinase